MIIEEKVIGWSILIATGHNLLVIEIPVYINTNLFLF